MANLHQTDILNHVQIKVEEVDENNAIVTKCETDSRSTAQGKRGRKRKKLADEEDECCKRSDGAGSPQVKVENIDGERPAEGQQALDPSGSEEESSSEYEGEDDDDDIEDEDEDEEESDEESAKPIATRRRSARLAPSKHRTRKTSLIRTSADKDALIRKHFENLHCDQCGQMAGTFSQLESHCRKVHDSPAVVVCCNRPYQKQVGLYNHLCRHKSIYKFHCKECDRCFKNADGLSMHNLLHHTPEEEKKFRCNLCDRAFATETFLTSHLNWHATVEPKNIVCQKCNK